MPQLALWLLKRPAVRRLLIASAVVLACAPLVALVVIVLTFSGAFNDASAVGAGSCTDPAAILSPDGVTAGGLDAEQKQTAADIVSEGRQLNISDYGLVVAIAASLQESHLRPLTHGDRDSLGPFQQRSGWGPSEDRINPVTSAHMFFTGGGSHEPGLLNIQNWQQMSVTQAAQAVQQSAFPDAYAKWESQATQTVAQLLGTAPNVNATGACATTTTTTTAPGGSPSTTNVPTSNTTTTATSVATPAPASP